MPANLAAPQHNPPLATGTGGRLAGRVAIVTGGASGIGRAIAEAFCEEGAAVVVADLTSSSTEEAAAALRHGGAAAIGVALDVSDAASVERLAAETFREFGAADILVNSAGIGRDVPFLDTDPETARRIIDVNLMGTFLCGQAVARLMARRGSGSIINIASVSGQRGNLGRAAYGASKGGVITLTQVMAVELAPLGIRVNAIAPGPVETPLVARMHTQEVRRAWVTRVPLARYADVAEFRGPALFLAGDESTYVTGHVLNVDGGFLATGFGHAEADPLADRA